MPVYNSRVLAREEMTQVRVTKRQCVCNIEPFRYTLYVLLYCNLQLFMYGGVMWLMIYTAHCPIRRISVGHQDHHIFSPLSPYAVVLQYVHIVLVEGTRSIYGHDADTVLQILTN